MDLNPNTDAIVRFLAKEARHRIIIEISGDDCFASDGVAIYRLESYAAILLAAATRTMPVGPGECKFGMHGMELRPKASPTVKELFDQIVAKPAFSLALTPWTRDVGGTASRVLRFDSGELSCVDARYLALLTGRKSNPHDYEYRAGGSHEAVVISRGESAMAVIMPMLSISVEDFADVDAAVGNAMAQGGLESTDAR